MNSPIIEKLKKLLAMAQSQNVNERDIALAKASSLAAEHSIDIALLDLSDVGRVKDTPMERGDVETGSKQFDPVRRFVNGVISEFFNVSAVICYKKIAYIGRAHDVAFAQFLFPYLLDQFRERWNTYRKEKLHTFPASFANREQNTFYMAMFHGLRERLLEERAELESRKRSQYGNSEKFTLALVAEKDKRVSAIKDHFAETATIKSRPITVRNAATVVAGRAAGRTVSTNRVLQ